MDLLKIYSEAVKDRFSAALVVKGIEKEICKLSEKMVYDKYVKGIIHIDNYELELGGVRCTLSSYDDDLCIEQIHVCLTYFCISKLPKDKREKLEIVKGIYKDRHRVGYCNYKIPAWRELWYKLNVEDILCGNVNLINW